MMNGVVIMDEQLENETNHKRIQTLHYMPGTCQPRDVSFIKSSAGLRTVCLKRIKNTDRSGIVKDVGGIK